jgi:hypothetical protein
MAKTSVHPLSRFQKADQEFKPRMIGRSYGEPGSRKTSFWLEAPGPIVVFSFDKGLEGVVERYQNEKDIYVKEYDWSPTDDLSQDAAIEIRQEWIADFEHAIQHACTVVIDKETDLWELFRYAEFGAPNDAPRNYPQLNQRYRKYMNMPKATNINFGVIQSMKDEWVTRAKKDGSGDKGVATGRRIPVGFGELEGLVHVNLFHRGHSPASWSVSVGKVRGPNVPDVADQVFENPTFVDLAMLMFPGSSEGDWS